MDSFVRYVTIQRGNRPSSDDETASNRFGGGSRTRGNINQVGSSSISRFGSAQSAFRTRLRQPRDRVAALRESANRRRRSPDTLSIVYPSPSLNELEDKQPAEEIIPALPVEANINYVFPASQSHIREKKQINVPLDVEESRKVEEKAEFDEEDDDYDGWEILDTEVEQSVSQSVSVSKSFSVSQILSDIVDYVVTTISPLTTDANSEEVVTTESIEVETSTGEEEAELESTTTTTIKIEAEKPATKKLSDLFKPRVHPFLASKSTTSTTTEAPTTRRSFLLKKTTETASTVEEEEGNEESTEKDVDLKLMKMMNILNNRDAKEEMKEDNEVISEETTTTEKADFLLSNRNERPKFQVPPSLQAKLKQDVVVESATPKASSKDDKKVISPLKLFNKPTLLRPFKPKPADAKPKFSINSKPIELPRKNPIRTNKPLDLDVSPSSTITRSRSSLLRRPSGLSESNSRTVFSTTSTTTTVAPSTEKLTVGEILAGLHGEVQPEPKTFSRQHSFKPKSGNHNKLRAKLRQQLEQEDDGTSTNEEVIEEDVAKDVTQLLEEAKEPQPEVVETPSRLSNARRVRPNRLERPTAVRPAAVVQQETKPSLRTRRPVSRQPLRTRPQQVPEVQQQEQQPQEEVEELAGQRVLSGDDLLSSLGLMDDKMQKEKTTAKPSEQPLGILESLFENKVSGPPVAIEAEAEPQEQNPPSLEAILKSAVVDSLDVPIKEEKRKQPQVRPLLQTRPPPLASRPASTSSRSRSRARITNPIHRFRPTTQGEVASTTETATRSAVINNRRLRVRQRGRGSSSSAAAEAVTSTPAVTLDNAVPSTEAVIPSTRSSSRFSNRRRIVNRGRTSAASTASTTSKSVEIPSTSRNVAAFGTRTSNLRTSDRINNRVRVRSRARQPIRASTPIENEESAIETVKEPQEAIEAIPATPNETKPGKLPPPSTSEESVENIVTEEETEEENSEDEETEVVTLRPGNFRPRFGTKQRNAVRNKLRAQLQDDNDVTSEEEVDTTSEAPAFKTVSPSEGLASLPISFFTTPQRFVPTSTTESPSTTSEINFLPTLTPLQRVGRSTVGYTDAPPTKRPKFNALRRKGSRPKFGQKFTTANPISEAEDTGVSFGISTTLLPTTLGNYSTEETTTEKIQVEDLKKEESQRKTNGGNSNFSFFKKRGNFLKSLDKKIEHIKYTEKALLDSFGGPQKSKNQISGRVSFGNFDLKNSLKRPRRRFNQASKSDDSNEVLEEKIKVNHTASDIKASEDENASIKVVDLTTTTTTELPLSENVIEEKKKPKIPKFELPKGLPKGFKLPFSNNRFGALQPKLLSFKIIRTTPTTTTTETSTTISSGSTEVTPPDTTSSSSKKLAFKDKLKFGRRKTFGSLLKPKRPKLLPSFLPTPAPTTTTLGTSTPIPQTTPEETQVDFRGNRKIFKP